MTTVFDPRRIVNEITTRDVRLVSELILELMQFYPSYKHVTREQAYGQPFESDRQQRGFFARLGSGEISVPYVRTGALARSWTLRNYGDYAIVQSPMAGLVMGEQQSQLSKLIGWRTVQERLNDARPAITALLARKR